MSVFDSRLEVSMVMVGWIYLWLARSLLFSATWAMAPLELWQALPEMGHLQTVAAATSTIYRR